MKKIFLSLLVALFAITASATDVISSGQSYYIQNVESGLFLSGNNAWGTQASVTPTGDLFKLDLNNGVYTITNTELTSGNKTLGYNLYVDTNAGQNGNAWTIAPVSGETGVFTIYGKGKKDNVDDAFDGYIAQGGAGDVVGYLAVGVPSVTDAAKWRFLTKEEVLKNMKYSATTPGNATFLISNASFTRSHSTNAWIVAPGCTNKNLAGGATNNLCAESYHSIFDIYQEISVPNATYELTAQGFYRQDGTDNDHLPVFYANDQSVGLPLKTGTENNMTEASNSFTKGLYTTEKITVTVTDGTLRVGFKNEQANLWCIWDNVQITLVDFKPALGEPVFVPANDAKMSAEELTSMKVSYPQAEVEEGLGYSVNAEWILKEDGKEIQSGEGAFDVTGFEVPVEAGVGHTYTLEVYPTLNGPEGKAVDTREDAASVKTLTLSELAKAEYEDAVAEADEHLEFAKSHIGVGVMLYLPAVVKKYEENLKLAKTLLPEYPIYNDYKEGTDLIRSIMMECHPQFPNSNQRYVVQQKSSKLYMNVADDKVTLAAAPTPVAFHHIEGANEESTYYMYSTPDRKYVYYTGENAWSLKGQVSKLSLGHWQIVHNHATQAYNLVGANGALGSDKVDAGEGIFGNKKTTDANSQWLLIPYTEPELSAEDLTAGDYYIRNRETGMYFGAANSWGTQASLVKHGHKFTATLIMDGVYNLDSHVANNASNHFLGAGFVDAAPASLAIAPAGNGYYTITEGGQYYSAPAEGTVIGVPGEYAGAKSEWEFLTKKDLLDEVAAGESDDLTFLIADANFSRNNQDFGAWQIAPGKGGDNANMNAEKWGGNSKEFDSNQTIELPNGVYKLSVQGFYRYNNTEDNTNEVAIAAHADGTEEINSYFYGNDVAKPLMSIAENTGALPFSQTEASAAFNQGLYQNSLIVEVTDGKLKLGIKKTSHPGCDWTVWDNFELAVASEADIALAAMRATAEEEATAISSASTSATPVAVFSANGAQLKAAQKGINIVRMSDGSVRKVLVK